MIRCRSHHQGDRCRKASGHESPHEGQFNIWTDRGSVIALAPIRVHRRDLKKAEAILRFAYRNPSDPRAKEFLGKALQLLNRDNLPEVAAQ